MVESLRDLKVATPPCAAKAAIPCGLATSKFEEYTKCPPYDFNHTEDELFYEHRSIWWLFFDNRPTALSKPETG